MTAVAGADRATAPGDTGAVAALPEPRGPVSAAVVAALRGSPAPPSGPDRLADVLPGLVAEAEAADPLGDDAVLALHVCYELHYRGWRGVDPAWEWDPGLLRLRAALEARFEDALRAAVADRDPDAAVTVADVDAELDTLLVETVPGAGVSHFVRDDAAWQQVREHLAHRSIYHHKEADPHVWVVPRLRGRAKAALVAVEFDEFGAGSAARSHQQLYVDLLGAAGLDQGYLAYLDDVPAPAIALVNAMSMFGLHRRLRGALVGHFAAAEITTAPSATRVTEGLRRLGCGPSVTEFFTEHIEADAVHEQVMRLDVIGDLLATEPELAGDVVFGIRATEHLEGRYGEHVLGAWRSGRSSLRRPLPDHPGPSGD